MNEEDSQILKNRKKKTWVESWEVRSRVSWEKKWTFFILSGKFFPRTRRGLAQTHWSLLRGTTVPFSEILSRLAEQVKRLFRSPLPCFMN
jgi:hypothetical protein